MITGNWGELAKIIEVNKCPTHDKPLVVAWHAGENSYVIRCGGGHFPEELEALQSITREVKTGVVEPVEGRTDFMRKVDLGSGALLAPDSIRGLFAYAKRYGLDANLGHVVLMYGEPYIGIDGYLYHARQEKIAYSLRSRPLEEGERKAMMVEEGDHAWTAGVEILVTGQYFVGIGIITKQEIEEEAKGKPGVKRYPIVAAKPWQMCQKRAEWQALRRAFPIGESEKGGENVDSSS